jgi:CRP-like cAMP-binding protein
MKTIKIMPVAASKPEARIAATRETPGEGGSSLNIEALLTHLPLFTGLAPDEINRLAQGTREVRVARGDLVFHKGDPCTGFHMIVYGQVKLGFTSPQGDEKVVEIIGQGQSFGEAIMFMERPYLVFAQALADSTLLHISKTVLFAELERDPKLGRKMLASLSARMHQLVTDVESLSLRSGKERIIGYLLRETPVNQEQDEVTITLPTQKGIIASRLNLTQEHFSRILHELTQSGLIEVQGRKIHIPSISKLRDAPC